MMEGIKLQANANLTAIATGILAGRRLVGRCGAWFSCWLRARDGSSLDFEPKRCSNGTGFLFGLSWTYGDRCLMGPSC